MKVLVTCPPMLGMIDSFRPLFDSKGVELTAPKVVQTLSIDELIALVPQHDGWIIGDDPATREVFSAGIAGQLKAAVKWGIGVDNVDFSACKDLGIPITNTPNMFGAEVADIAVGYPALSKAHVIHAITPLEKKHLESLFPNKRIEVIPNAIDVNALDVCPQVERSKTILFLGRIEPKKGVDLLLRAFARAKIGKDWAVDVVGPAWSQAYLSELKAIVDECGLGARVRFRGPLFGEEKHKLIESAWVLAAPSHSEVVGLVNLEAAAQYLPSITTHQTGLSDWELGGGMLVAPNVDGVVKALESACAWTTQEQHDRGLASRQLVLQRYSWQAILPQWMELYSSLII